MFDNNHSLLLYLRLSKFFKAELSCQQQLRMLQLRQDDLAEILAGMDLSSNECDKLEYRQFFELSGTDAEELEAKDLIAKVSMDAFDNYAQVMPNFTVSQINHCIDDEVTFCLLNLLVLFNVDGGAGGALENRSYCEEVQVTSLKCAEFNYRIKVLITFFFPKLRVSSLLYRYLQSKYSVAKSRRKFAAALRIVSHCSELREITAAAVARQNL